MTQEKERLAEELRQRSEGSHARGNWNHYAAYGVGLVAIAASVLTTVSIASEWPKVVSITLAALPGAAAALDTLLNFESRANWWWAKYRRFDDLRRALLYEGHHESAVSNEMSSFLEIHEQVWPKFGQLEGALKKLNDAKKKA